MGQDFQESYLDGAFLVIAATDDMDLNHQISKAAENRGILVNAVDQPKDCSFIVPAIVNRGDLLIAISTSGKSPALAKKIRQRLSNQFGDEYAEFLNLMGRLRRHILEQGFSQKENSQLFQSLVDSQVLEAIAEKDWTRVASILNKVLKTSLSLEDILNYLKG